MTAHKIDWRDFFVAAALSAINTAVVVCAFVGVFVIGAYINGWRPV